MNAHLKLKTLGIFSFFLFSSISLWAVGSDDELLGLLDSASDSGDEVIPGTPPELQGLRPGIDYIPATPDSESESEESGDPGPVSGSSLESPIVRIGYQVVNRALMSSSQGEFVRPVGQAQVPRRRGRSNSMLEDFREAERRERGKSPRSDEDHESPHPVEDGAEGLTGGQEIVQHLGEISRDFFSALEADYLVQVIGPFLVDPSPPLEEKCNVLVALEQLDRAQQLPSLVSDVQQFVNGSCLVIFRSPEYNHAFRVHLMDFCTNAFIHQPGFLGQVLLPEMLKDPIYSQQVDKVLWNCPGAINPGTLLDWVQNYVMNPANLIGVERATALFDSWLSSYPFPLRWADFHIILENIAQTWKDASQLQPHNVVFLETVLSIEGLYLRDNEFPLFLNLLHHFNWEQFEGDPFGRKIAFLHKLLESDSDFLENEKAIDFGLDENQFLFYQILQAETLLPYQRMQIAEGALRNPSFVLSEMNLDALMVYVGGHNIVNAQGEPVHRSRARLAQLILKKRGELRIRSEYLDIMRRLVQTLHTEGLGYYRLVSGLARRLARYEEVQLDSDLDPAEAYLRQAMQQTDFYGDVDNVHETKITEGIEATLAILKTDSQEPQTDETIRQYVEELIPAHALIEDVRDDEFAGHALEGLGALCGNDKAISGVDPISVLRIVVNRIETKNYPGIEKPELYKMLVSELRELNFKPCQHGHIPGILLVLKGCDPDIRIEIPVEKEIQDSTKARLFEWLSDKADEETQELLWEILPKPEADRDFEENLEVDAFLSECEDPVREEQWEAYQEIGVSEAIFDANFKKGVQAFCNPVGRAS